MSKVEEVIIKFNQLYEESRNFRSSRNRAMDHVFGKGTWTDERNRVFKEVCSILASRGGRSKKKKTSKNGRKASKKATVVAKEVSKEVAEKTKEVLKTFFESPAAAPVTPTPTVAPIQVQQTNFPFYNNTP